MKNKAFSLAELLVAIVIIGVLAAYTIPTYRNYTNKAMVSQMIEALSTCQLAASTYYHDKFGFPLILDCFGGITQNTITPIPQFNGSFYFTTGTTTYGTPKLYMYLFRNDLLAPDGVTPAHLYIGLYAKNNVLYSNCGTWNNGTQDVSPDLLPGSCKDQVSTTVWTQ